jgi:hypothetical protein
MRLWDFCAWGYMLMYLFGELGYNFITSPHIPLPCRLENL